jgi:hypothetical protein
MATAKTFWIKMAKTGENRGGSTEKPIKKWVTFTYMGKETRYVTKPFKKYNVNIAWCTNNSLEQHLSKKRQKRDQYDRCGIYKLICLECGGAYVGQMGRKFRTRYKEHIRDIRNNKENMGYSHHILSTGRVYGTLEDTLQIVKIQSKGPHLNTLERFHIYIYIYIYIRKARTGLLLNDTYTDQHNPLFELVTRAEREGRNNH